MTARAPESKSRRRLIGDLSLQFAQAQGTGEYIMGPGRATLVGATSAAAAVSCFKLNPQDTPELVNYEVEAEFYSNSVDPGAGLFRVGLRPVTLVSGATSGAITVALGAVVAGSTITKGPLGASAMISDKSGLFTGLAAGFYVLTVLATAANVNTSSGVGAVARLMAEKA